MNTFLIVGIIVILLLIIMVVVLLIKKNNKPVVNNYNNFKPVNGIQTPILKNNNINNDVKRVDTSKTINNSVSNTLNGNSKKENEELLTVPVENLFDSNKNIEMKEIKSIEQPELNRDDDEKVKEEIILKLPTASNKKTPYKVRPLVHADTEGEKVSVTEEKALKEKDEPKYDKIPKYVDPKTIKENGVDAEVTEAKALKESKKNEIDVFDDTHKAENLPLTNEKGTPVVEVKSVPLKETYEYDPEDDEIDNQPQNTETKSIDESYEEKKLRRRKEIESITMEELNKYILEIQDSMIEEANNYIEEMKGKRI